MFVTIKRRRMESGMGYSTSPSMTSVVIDDGYDWRNETTAQPSQRQSPTATPQPYMPSEAHTNSVYIDEEEPLDMFDIANKQPQAGSADTPPLSPTSSVNDRNDLQQTPSQPHSTRP